MFIPRSIFSVKKDRADYRDYSYNFPENNEPEESVDLRPWCSPVEDQLQLGSCVGQAIVGAFEMTINKLYPDRFVDLSRLFVYYNARYLDGYTDEDVGTYVRNGIKAVNKWGVCKEEVWPYLVERFAQAPSIPCYQDASARLITNYYRIRTRKDMIGALNLNYPVVISMKVYDSFYELNEPGIDVMPMPGPKEELIGGHAVTLVGYDLIKSQFLARNSFGADWAMNGYFWVPFDFVPNNFMDCWIFDIELT